MSFKLIKLFSILYLVTTFIHAADTKCFQAAVQQIKKNYPASTELLSFIGAPQFLAGLIDCNRGIPNETLLPNFYHELVHYSGFKILGFGADRIKVERTDVARIFSGRSKNDLNDEAFFINAKKKIMIRELVTPDRREFFGQINAACRANPNFEIYLGGHEEGGLLSLMDELHAYTEELKYAMAVYPRSIPNGKRTIQKDNIAAFQYMLLFYLKNLRENYADEYAQVKNHSALKDLLLILYNDSEQALIAVQDEVKFSKIRYAWPKVKQQADALKSELKRVVQ